MRRIGSLFRLQLREQDHIADAFLTEEHHAKSINAHAHATRRGHPVFERNQEIFIELLLPAAGVVIPRGA